MVFSMTSQDSQDFLTQRINRTCTRPCIRVLNISCHSISNPHFCFNYAYEIPGVSVNPHGISVAPRQVWWVCLTSTGWSWDTRIRLRTCLDFIWGFYQRWQKRMTEVCNSYGISWITWVSVGWIDSILMYIDVRCSRFSLQTNVDRRSQEKLVFLIEQIEEVSQSSFSAWSSVMVNVRQCGSTLDVPRFFFVERLGNVQIYVIFIWLWSKKNMDYDPNISEPWKKEFVYVLYMCFHQDKIDRMRYRSPGPPCCVRWCKERPWKVSHPRCTGVICVNWAGWAARKKGKSRGNLR